MRNLILISLLVFVLTGCHFSFFHPWKKIKDEKVKGSLQSYFNSPDSNYLYLTDIRFMKNYYSGIMAIKLQGDSIHRVVFITEMGIKIFDFEIRNPLENKKFYKVHYMMEPILKKIIQKTLANDLGMLLQNPLSCKKLLFKTDVEEQVVKIKNHGLRYYYVFDKDQTMYKKILFETALFKKGNVEFWNNSDDQPDSVKINHHGIKLNYTFRKLKQ